MNENMFKMGNKFIKIYQQLMEANSNLDVDTYLELGLVFMMKKKSESN